MIRTVVRTKKDHSSESWFPGTRVPRGPHDTWAGQNLLGSEWDQVFPRRYDPSQGPDLNRGIDIPAWGCVAGPFSTPNLDETSTLTGETDSDILKRTAEMKN